VTARLSLRVTQYFVTVKICRHDKAYTIQIVHAHVRDLTMAAASHAYGMARAAPSIMYRTEQFRLLVVAEVQQNIIQQYKCHY